MPSRWENSWLVTPTTKSGMLWSRLGLIICFLVLDVELAEGSIARILIFSRTVEFRHDSIPTAIEALKSHSSTIDVVFDQTEDQSLFTDDNLQKYDGLVFLSNTGEVLDEPGKIALHNYLNKGGNFAAVHSASDCLRTTSFYGREVGAYFDYHPELQNAIVDVIGPSHPSTAELPTTWKVMDEIYNFKSDPRSVGAIVVLAANESSYSDNGVRKFDQGVPHPIAWYQEHGSGVDQDRPAGRSFYTGLGHLNETWKDETFLSHVLGGLHWALQSNTTLAFNSQGLVGNSKTNSRSVSALTSTATPLSSITMPPQDSGTSILEYPWALWLTYLALSIKAVIMGL
ncbi:hypothetical protein Ac2012v2_002525 [Leucoagaricus gongylophorus]